MQFIYKTFKFLFCLFIFTALLTASYKTVYACSTSNQQGSFCPTNQCAYDSNQNTSSGTQCDGCYPQPNGSQKCFWHIFVCDGNYCNGGGGGVGGGAACLGCNGSGPNGLMGNITSVNASRTSPTTAIVYWGTDTDGCYDNGGMEIFATKTPSVPVTYNGDGSVNTICGFPNYAMPQQCNFGDTSCSTQWTNKRGDTFTYTIDPNCAYATKANWYTVQCQTNKNGKDVCNNVPNYSQNVTGIPINSVYYFWTMSEVTVIGPKGGLNGGGWCSYPPGTGYVSSCSLYPPSSTIRVGDTQTLTNTVNQSSAITNVDFSGAPTYLSYNPNSTAASPYQTLAKGIASSYGVPQTVTSNVYLSGMAGAQCTASAQVAILSPATANPWWQVKDGDVTTNGDLKSTIPSGQLFGLPGSGGYPGVPAYGGTTNLTTTNVSATGWLANSTITNSKVFDYSFFANQIPADAVIYNLPSNTLDQTAINANTTSSYGYYWYKFDGSGNGLDLNLNSNLSIGSKKVILLVNSANFLVKGKINLIKGQGFFMTIVGKNAGGSKGNISVDPAVGGGAAPSLEGIYEADGAFSDGTLNPSVDNQLWVRGSVAAYGGVNLQRDLGGIINLTTPAELFEYAPDQIMLFPSKLGFRKINWKEVAP